MRLELGTFPVHDIVFGAHTRWSDGRLEVNRDELLAAVRADPRIATVDLELARPGESVRIWPLRDVVEPRVKVSGAGVAYPGVCGRPIETVGAGRTHRLAGMGVAEVSEVNWPEAGGDFVEVFIDMSGPWAERLPLASLLNLCVVVEPDAALGNDARNEAVHAAVLTVADRLAATTKDLEPPEQEIYELPPVDPALPRVVYIWCLHSPQAMSGSPTTWCTATYGLTHLTPPWLLHPNEVLDGAVTGPYRSPFAMSWTVMNNPALRELYRRHGVDLNFLGVIAFRTEWTTQHEKQLMANQAAKMARMLDAQGALVTWDAGGNEFIEVIRTVQACEQLGIKTVFMTGEDSSAGGVPTLLEPLPEADAIVSTGFIYNDLTDLKSLPSVERVIGSDQRVIGRLRDQQVPTAGPLEPPRRYDDHYGFNRYSGLEA